LADFSKASIEKLITANGNETSNYGLSSIE